MAESAVIMRSGTPANILRQAGMMVGIAASVALGVYVVMWARTPNYSMLYSDLSDRDVTQIAEALKSTEIPHRIDPGSGAILVAASRVHDARLKLAAAGLPKSAGMGFELMQEEQGFGTSQFLERARYQRAIEGELSRSISRINNVRNARVHLGLPPQTVFSRSQREPTASVILDLYSGRKLESHQVSAITHLVSASVPNLPANKVTVVDQQGSLLTDQGGNEEVVVTGRRFEHRQRLENEYMKRIENILMPFVGADGVRAQVTADLDFTITEQTRESFNPDLPAVRSERLLEESRVGAGIGGVPGALSNEPPGTASAPEEVADATGEGVETASTAKPESIRTQTTRNYELDRTISHTKPSLGSIRRLSVAVVVRSPAPAPAADAGVEDDTAPAPYRGTNCADDRASERNDRIRSGARRHSERHEHGFRHAVGPGSVAGTADLGTAVGLGRRQAGARRIARAVPRFRGIATGYEDARAHACSVRRPVYGRRRRDTDGAAGWRRRR
jgi:flagellar M-ring protein FliF